MRLFKSLAKDSDVEWELLDGSYVKAHQHSAGAASQQDQAIGLSRGGNTSKIHLAVDSYGLPIEFIITGGDVHDSKVANELIALLPQSDFIITDKGYDSEAIRNKIRERNSIPVIPRKKNSKVGNADIDWCLYKYRHLVENSFARLKHFRAIATKYDKLKMNFESARISMRVDMAANVKDQQPLVIVSKYQGSVCGSIMGGPSRLVDEQSNHYRTSRRVLAFLNAANTVEKSLHFSFAIFLSLNIYLVNYSARLYH